MFVEQFDTRRTAVVIIEADRVLEEFTSGSGSRR